MIIEMNVKKQNSFEIKVNNELKYYSDMKKDTKITAYMKGEGTLISIDGSICYKLLPAEDFSAFTGKSRGKYCIFNNLNQNCGRIYKLISGFLDSKYIIEYEGYKFTCYRKGNGKKENFSIYNGEIQIAEIVKSVELLADYYIFLLDEYANLESIFSLFVSYSEFLDMYDDEGNGVVGVSYTYDKNNKFYNKHWIENHFTKEEVLSINEKIQKGRKEIVDSIKRYGKFIISLFVIALLIVLIVFGVVYYINYV